MKKIPNISIIGLIMVAIFLLADIVEATTVGTDISSGGNLTVAGTIKLGNETFFVDPNNHWVGIGTTNPTQALEVNGTIKANDIISKGPAVDVRAYGAVGNGVTDDTTAIQAALDATAAASGAKIVTGGGRLYKVSATINLPSNIELRDLQLLDPSYRTAHHRFLMAENKSNIKLENIVILGNNASYANDTDGFIGDVGDGFSDGTGIAFRNVTNGQAQNIRCQYLNEGMVISLSTNVNVDGFESRQGETWTETGLGLHASFNTHVRNARIYNGSDGALFIYNGVDCSITDSYVEATNPAVFDGCGAGIETCNNCFITNTTVKGCWIGFSALEAASEGGFENCTADGCHVGFGILPFGYGSAGVNLFIKNSRVTNMTDLGINYPVSGIFIYNDNNTYRTSASINIEGNYVGKSNVGIPLYINLPSGKEIAELNIANNIFEASTFASYDWSINQLNQTYSTNNKVAQIQGVNGATVSGNTFVTRIETQVHPNYEFEILRSKKIIFTGNHIEYGGFNNFMNTDADCEDIQITNNVFEDAPVGGYHPFYLLGENINAKDNMGWDDIFVATTNTGIDMGTHHAFGYNGVRYRGPSDTGILITLPAGYAGAEFSFQNSGGLNSSMYLDPSGTEKIRGYETGDDYISVGTGNSVVLRWTEANLWESVSLLGADMLGKYLTDLAVPDCEAKMEGKTFYNDTGNYMCFCDGTDWKQFHSPATNCF